MTQRKKKRVGVIGYGQIGSSLCKQVSQDPVGDFAVTSIMESRPETIAMIPKGLFQPSIEEILKQNLDLVVEAAHPEAVRCYAESVLRKTDLMIMSAPF